MKNLMFIVLSLIVLSVPAYAKDPTLDFRTGAGQDAWEWLAAKNFIFARSADNKNATSLKLDKDKGLIVEALKGTQSIIGIKKGHLENYRDIEIHWGVDKFPKGASYAKKKRNEAIMVQVFFGTEMIDSGSIVIPDAPYFIALHLCENDEINKPEKGGYFHEGGRFVCVAHPKPGEVVTTKFNLKKAFKDYYGFEAPPIYGLALEFDTSGAPDGGKTAAFVKKIEFPAATYIRED